MSDYRHRRNAKIIGWIDLIFTTQIFVILIISLILVLTEYNAFKKKEEVDLFTMSYIKFLLLGLILEVISKVFQLSAAIALIKATDISQDPCKALSLIECWRWVAVLEFVLDCQGMLILIVCYDFNQGFLRFLGLALELIPILFVLIVNDFVGELKHRLRLKPCDGTRLSFSISTMECG